jgi:hypothetical protein
MAVPLCTHGEDAKTRFRNDWDSLLVAWASARSDGFSRRLMRVRRARPPELGFVNRDIRLHFA